jgi:small subunit ribosomal protein S13
MYILDTNLDENIKITLSLTSVYGLSIKKSKQYSKKLGFSKNILITELSKTQQTSIKTVLNNQKNYLSSLLKKKIVTIRSKKTEIKHLKELRRLKGYPVNGQRTRTNAKTAKKKLFLNVKL